MKKTPLLFSLVFCLACQKKITAPTSLSESTPVTLSASTFESKLLSSSNSTGSIFNGGVTFFFIESSSSAFSISANPNLTNLPTTTTPLKGHHSYFFANENSLPTTPLRIPNGNYSIYAMGFSSPNLGVNMVNASITGTDYTLNNAPIINGAPFCAVGTSNNSTTDIIPMTGSAVTISFNFSNNTCLSRALPSNTSTPVSALNPTSGLPTSVFSNYFFSSDSSMSSLPNMSFLTTQRSNPALRKTDMFSFLPSSSSANNVLIDNSVFEATHAQSILSSSTPITWSTFSPTFFVSAKINNNAQAIDVNTCNNVLLSNTGDLTTLYANFVSTSPGTNLLCQTAYTVTETNSILAVKVFIENDNQMPSSITLSNGTVTIDTSTLSTSTHNVSCIRTLNGALSDYLAGNFGSNLSLQDYIFKTIGPALLPTGNIAANSSDVPILKIPIFIVGYSDTACANPVNAYEILPNLAVLEEKIYSRPTATATLDQNYIRTFSAQLAGASTLVLSPQTAASNYPLALDVINAQFSGSTIVNYSTLNSNVSQSTSSASMPPYLNTTLIPGDSNVNAVGYYRARILLLH
jgi:hypothetical protein